MRRINMPPKSPLDFLQNLQPAELKTAAARRFADFCLQDFDQHMDEEGFDLDVYADAVKLVVERLEAARRGELTA